MFCTRRDVYSFRNILFVLYVLFVVTTNKKNWDEKSLEEELSFFLNAGHLASFVVH